MGIEQGPSGQESADLEILRAKVREAASSSRTSGEARFTDKFDAGELLDEDLEIAHRANTAGVTTGEFQCWKKTVLDHELQRSGRTRTASACSAFWTCRTCLVRRTARFTRWYSGRCGQKASLISM